MTISVITTCKNRLDHLQQTLPHMLKYPFDEVVVVDYGCQQGTEKWVSRNFRNVKIAKVSDDSQFSLARARNIGAQHAKGELYFFIDADTIIVADIADWIVANYKNDRFFLVKDRKRVELGGAVICHSSDFVKVGGYDEAFRGWGSEDADFYERLILSGLTVDYLPEGSLNPIQHGDDVRQLGARDPLGYKNKRQALVLGELYRLVKIDAQRLINQDLDLDTRKLLFSKILLAHHEAAERHLDQFTFVFTLPFEEHRNRFSKARRSISYVAPVIR